jgi:hypothetical protein
MYNTCVNIMRKYRFITCPNVTRLQSDINYSKSWLSFSLQLCKNHLARLLSTVIFAMHLFALLINGYVHGFDAEGERSLNPVFGKKKCTKVPEDRAHNQENLSCLTTRGH